MTTEDDFDAILEGAQRLTQSLGLSSNSAYDDLRSPSLSSEEAILPPEGPSPEEERQFLTDLPGLEDEPVTQAQPVQDDLECGYSLLQRIEKGIGDDVAELFAPPPLSEEFCFHKASEDCGYVHTIFTTFRGVLVGGQEPGPVDLA